MTVILKELFERYCLTIEEVKPFLSKKYNINNVQDDLVLEDDQAEYLIDTIYGKIENDVDINYSKLTTVENILNSDNDNGEGGDDWSNEEDDEWTDEWGEDFYKRKMKIFLIVHQKTNFCILVDILLALIVVK